MLLVLAFLFAASAAERTHTVALKMAESNEFPGGRGRGRGYELNKWLEDNPNRRRTVGGEGISRDEVIEEMGKVVKRSTGTQWEEQERPVCVVGPNNHLRTGGRRGGGIARGQLIGL